MLENEMLKHYDFPLMRARSLCLKQGKNVNVAVLM